MTMDQERRDLARQARTLKASVLVGKAGATDAVIQQVRAAFRRAELIKVRFQPTPRSEIRALAEALAAAVPCRVIQLIGFVAVLHRPGRDGG